MATSDAVSGLRTMTSTGGDPSYVELLSCLEMSRDAKKIAQERPSDQMDKPAPATRRHRH